MRGAGYAAVGLVIILLVASRLNFQAPLSVISSYTPPGYNTFTTQGTFEVIVGAGIIRGAVIEANYYYNPDNYPHNAGGVSISFSVNGTWTLKQITVWMFALVPTGLPFLCPTPDTTNCVTFHSEIWSTSYVTYTTGWFNTTYYNVPFYPPSYFLVNSTNTVNSKQIPDLSCIYFGRCAPYDLNNGYKFVFTFPPYKLTTGTYAIMILASPFGQIGYSAKTGVYGDTVNIAGVTTGPALAPNTTCEFWSPSIPSSGSSCRKFGADYYIVEGIKNA